MNTLLEQDTLQMPAQTDIEQTGEAKELIDSIRLSTESETTLKHLQHLCDEENHVILNSRCEHKGPHGSRYHGERGGGWCYWCYICNPSNPKSY